MYRVIIVDDEPLARQLVQNMLQAHTDIEVVASCADGFEGLKAIQQHEPQLIFLDVQMPKVNGFEMLELLDVPPAVIFTTAFDEYAIKAFEAHAIDYLLKPITKERFEKAMQKWRQQIGNMPLADVQGLADEKIYEGYQHRIVVKDNGMIRIIPTQEIQYVEANDDYVKIVTADGSFMKKSTLSRIEAALDPAHFVRVHRSYLIPVSQLSRIEPYEKESHIAWLQCGAKVLVSKNGMGRLKALLGW